MKFWTNIKWRKIFRLLHRDIGYFFAGLSCLYAFSGVLLNIKTEGEDPAYSEIKINKKIPLNYTSQELKKNWIINLPEAPAITHVIVTDKNYRLYVKRGMGKYNPKTGFVSIHVYKEIGAIKFINDIHYNKGKRFTWLVNAFAISLLFLAISGIFIVKGKNGLRKRGVWMVVGGILLPVVMYYI